VDEPGVRAVAGAGQVVDADRVHAERPLRIVFRPIDLVVRCRVEDEGGLHPPDRPVHGLPISHVDLGAPEGYGVERHKAAGEIASELPLRADEENGTRDRRGSHERG